MTHTLGDSPISEKYVQQMRAIAATLDEVFNGDKRGEDRQTGFVLMVFPFGDDRDGRCNYISNGAQRDEIVILMKEMIARFEGQPLMSGKA